MSTERLDMIAQIQSYEKEIPKATIVAIDTLEAYADAIIDALGGVKVILEHFLCNTSFLQDAQVQQLHNILSAARKRGALPVSKRWTDVLSVYADYDSGGSSNCKDTSDLKPAAVGVANTAKDNFDDFDALMDEIDNEQGRPMQAKDHSGENTESTSVVKKRRTAAADDDKNEQDEEPRRTAHACGRSFTQSSGNTHRDDDADEVVPVREEKIVSDSTDSKPQQSMAGGSVSVDLQSIAQLSNFGQSKDVVPRKQSSAAAKRTKSRDRKTPKSDTSSGTPQNNPASPSTSKSATRSKVEKLAEETRRRRGQVRKNKTRTTRSQTMDTFPSAFAKNKVNKNKKKNKKKKKKVAIAHGDDDGADDDLSDASNSSGF
eukprot:CAMPEP_0202686888 /NCGR_PEP_ID=MMETSP1385-20130828/2646_1 /ASSEMBLY_ACC=CAM_ASM_000861 /TAXON_ID=933848 /ORGANISM="Elphidium margaritaceum" /LENGTH=373 /DNA_ID=CAMNT_0049341561 /DNA_START=29 /DNA_END=1150 /DNA_ORIENTATION=-